MLAEFSVNAGRMLTNNRLPPRLRGPGALTFLRSFSLSRHTTCGLGERITIAQSRGLVGSEAAQPHLKDSSVYRARWWGQF